MRNARKGFFFESRAKKKNIDEKGRDAACACLRCSMSPFTTWNFVSRMADRRRASMRSCIRAFFLLLLLRKKDSDKAGQGGDVAVFRDSRLEICTTRRHEPADGLVTPVMRFAAGPNNIPSVPCLATLCIH